MKWLILLAVLMLAPLGAVLWSLAIRRRKIRALEKEIAAVQARTAELGRAAAQMQIEAKLDESLALSLSPILKDLMDSNLGPEQVPKLISRLADAVFQPEQFLLYQTVLGPPNGDRELRLVAHHGFQKLPDGLRRITVGQGKIGWVAEHKQNMRHEDWHQAECSTGLRVQDNHPELKIDLVGPLVHATVEGDQVLGVLVIGSPARILPGEKEMLRFVADMSALAMVKAQQYSRLREQIRLARKDYEVSDRP